MTGRLRAMCILALLAAATPDGRAAGEAAPRPSDVERFCGNVIDAVREQRYARKRTELEGLVKDIDVRLGELEQRGAEIEKWIRIRDTFAAKAEESLVGIYGSMRPDAAAARIEKLAPELAAALLLKLPPRAAGVILNEMDAARAASITNVMVAAADRDGS